VSGKGGWSFRPTVTATFYEATYIIAGRSTNAGGRYWRSYLALPLDEFGLAFIRHFIGGGGLFTGRQFDDHTRLGV
jgi:hypothetical protein